MANDVAHLPDFQIKIHWFFFFFKATIKNFLKHEAKSQGRQRKI